MRTAYILGSLLTISAGLTVVLLGSILAGRSLQITRQISGIRDLKLRDPWRQEFLSRRIDLEGFLMSTGITTIVFGMIAVWSGTFLLVSLFWNKKAKIEDNVEAPSARVEMGEPNKTNGLIPAKQEYQIITIPEGLESAGVGPENSNVDEKLANPVVVQITRQLCEKTNKTNELIPAKQESQIITIPEGLESAGVGPENSNGDEKKTNPVVVQITRQMCEKTNKNRFHVKISRPEQKSE